MNSTELFKKTIQEHLSNLASQEPAFEAKLSNPTKSIDKCINYIFSQVKQSGCCGFADEEIFSMATHYYDEDNVEDSEHLNCQVIVNSSIPSPSKVQIKPLKGVNKKNIDKVKSDNPKFVQATLF